MSAIFDVPPYVAAPVGLALGLAVGWFWPWDWHGWPK